jgi:cyclopropane-fatty-acyl-phospholipid synthase
MGLRGFGMQAILDIIGRRFRRGSLEFRSPDGRVWTFGQTGPRTILRLYRPGALLPMLLNPQLRFGEGYMDGVWEPLDGDLLRVFEVVMLMLASADIGTLARLLQIGFGRLGEINSPGAARRNVSRHYDLDYALYSDFLDRDLHYSCAYFREPTMSLEDAQQSKCAHIAAKLDLRPGARVLDIGCGWGSMALYLAQRHGAQVTGITLSQEQLRIARQRAAERGLARQVEFRLEDYRQVWGEFDAIVSIGMFEHVGRPQYPTFFRQAHRLLRPDGTMLLHTIGRSTPPAACNPWIRKYVFPGGYIPSASEATAAIEPSGLVLNDLEVWQLHYAQTLAEWNRRFRAGREAIARRIGERFCRMWEFYLLVSEAGFRWGDLVVFQAQLTRSRDRLPRTRDYLLAGHKESDAQTLRTARQA